MLDEFRSKNVAPRKRMLFAITAFLSLLLWLAADASDMHSCFAQIGFIC